MFDKRGDRYFVSIHASTREATVLHGIATHHALFQSTPPRGRRQQVPLKR
ncbi:MAG TPA: hypothetical protein GXX60_03780 [Anaerolineaceae bacterium]|nr:hypothetical protein [Anaerolineaceae bacterium]